MESMRGVYIGRIWEDFRSLHIMHPAFFSGKRATIHQRWEEVTIIQSIQATRQYNKSSRERFLVHGDSGTADLRSFAFKTKKLEERCPAFLTSVSRC